jgi:hypothetical protein
MGSSVYAEFNTKEYNSNDYDVDEMLDQVIGTSAECFKMFKEIVLTNKHPKNTDFKERRKLYFQGDLYIVTLYKNELVIENNNHPYLHKISPKSRF